MGTINLFRYRSYYYDNETKLYYLNSRYYNPAIGRFINADGIINSNKDFISGNLFQYCSNNPIVNSDIDGNNIFQKAKKFLDNTRDNIHKAVNPSRKYVEKQSSLVTAFLKSIGANNNRTLSTVERAALIEDFKQNKKINDEITSLIATTPHNQTYFKASGSFKDASDTFVLKGVIGKFDYEIEGNLLIDNYWNIHVTISDTYNFDEYRKDWYKNPLSFANNIAFFGTNVGVVGEYGWSIDYSINRKDIWR